MSFPSGPKVYHCVSLDRIVLVNESLPSRRCYHHVGPFAQSDSLLNHIKTAKNQGTSQRDQGTESFERLCDLRGKFSGGGEDECEQGLRFVEKCLKNWEGECRRLSATGLGDTNYISVLKGERDRFRLDRGGFLVSESFAGLAEGVDNALVRCQPSKPSAYSTSFTGSITRLLKVTGAAS